MDKSNIAFPLLCVILGIYISVALLLSRTREARHRKSDRSRRTP